MRHYMYLDISPLFVYPLVTAQTDERIFRVFHRQLFCWIDKWHGMTMEDIRALEAAAQRELDEVCTCACVRAYVPCGSLCVAGWAVA